MKNHDEVILLDTLEKPHIHFSPAQSLISFFERVAKKDQIQLWELKQEATFVVKQKRWYFTLPDLYTFLQHQEAFSTSIDYKKFRQIIFSCPINRVAKLYGAEIVIDDNQGKVDQSRYALVWPNDER